MELSEILIGVAGIIGVFLIIREFWCWFFKSNEISSQVWDLSRKLEALSRKLEALSRKVDGK